jgi:hypothetical protein
LTQFGPIDPDLAAVVICEAVAKSRHVRSRSNGRARLQAARAAERGGGGNGRRRAAAGSPARHSSRVPGNGLGRGQPLREARRTANGSRAAVLAETQRRERSARRSGGASTATAPRRCGAWVRRQAARGCLLPPCAAPGWLHGDERAAMAALPRRRWARVPAACGGSEGGG